MSDTNTIKVSIEMGEGYRPTPRIAAAVEELEAALREAHGEEEVAGFEYELKNVMVTSFTIKLDAAWSPTGGLRGTKALCNNEVVEGVFKF